MAVDWEQCSRLVPHLFQDDLLAKGSLVRHDPRSLARLIYRIAEELSGERPRSATLAETKV